jgi:hypothetical protein
MALAGLCANTEISLPRTAPVYIGQDYYYIL